MNQDQFILAIAYQKNNLAGIRVDSGAREIFKDYPNAKPLGPNEGSYWNIVNFDAVSSVKLTVPQTGATGSKIFEFSFPP